MCLPTEEERVEIFKLHLEKRGHKIPKTTNEEIETEETNEITVEFTNDNNAVETNDNNVVETN